MNSPANKTWKCACGCGTTRKGQGHGQFSNEGGNWFWIASEEHGRRILRTTRMHGEDLTGRKFTR